MIILLKQELQFQLTHISTEFSFLLSNIQYI